MTKKPPTSISPYRLHKGSGQGYVVIDRRRVYLGRYELASSRERYGRVLAEWEANGRHLQVEPDDITITEVCVRYLAHAKRYYRKPITRCETALPRGAPSGHLLTAWRRPLLLLE